MDSEPNPSIASPHSCSTPTQYACVNGVRIDLVDHDSFFLRIEEFLSCGRSHVVQLLAADPTVRARRAVEYRAVLNLGDYNIPDGAPVAVAARLFGLPTVRQTGRQTMRRLLKWGVDRGVKHYFAGSTDGVLERLEGRIHAVLPGAIVVGRTSPPFRPLTPVETDALAARVREHGADVLWIGLGTPAQHLLARELAHRGAAPVIVCVGAAFEFLAGVKKRAPQSMQRFGLEWLHRLVTEPRRLWKRYLIGNPIFVLGIVRDAVAGRARRRCLDPAFADGRPV